MQLYNFYRKTKTKDSKHLAYLQMDVQKIPPFIQNCSYAIFDQREVIQLNFDKLPLLCSQITFDFQS